MKDIKHLLKAKMEIERPFSCLHYLPIEIRAQNKHTKKKSFQPGLSCYAKRMVPASLGFEPRASSRRTAPPPTDCLPIPVASVVFLTDKMSAEDVIPLHYDAKDVKSSVPVMGQKLNKEIPHDSAMSRIR